MKLTLFFVFIFSFSTLLTAQDDSNITYLDDWEKPTNKDAAVKYSVIKRENSHWRKSIFNIKNSDTIWTADFSDKECNLFEGSFRSYHPNGNISTRGQYTDNKKAGLWRSWSNDKKLIDSANYKNGFVTGIGIRWFNDGIISDSLIFDQNGNGIGKGFWQNGIPRHSGSYESGKKEGQWTYYYRSGIKCQEVRYQADSAIAFSCFDITGNAQSRDCHYEKEAEFKGGDKAWIRFLTQKISAVKMPKAFRQGKISGTVYVQFVVDTIGAVTELKIYRSVSPELDEIALDIVRDSPKWIPAVQYNRKVKAYRRQPITFAVME